MRESSYKIPGGKLVKIKLQISEKKITDVKILGDFFLHPEDTILKIEGALKGLIGDVTTIENTIAGVLEDSDATLIGASAADLANIIMMAWESE